MLEGVFHQCSLQSSPWWPHQWSLPQVSWKQRGRTEKLSGYTQLPGEIKFKRRERMVRANDKNVNCAPCHLGSSCIGWGPALFLVSSFLPTTWFLLTGFLETSIFEFWLFPPHFHNSIPHTADRFVNATSLLESLQWISNARSLLESLQWISMTLDYSLVLERLPSIFPSQNTRLCYLAPLAWSQAFFLCLPSSFP